MKIDLDDLRNRLNQAKEKHSTTLKEVSAKSASSEQPDDQLATLNVRLNQLKNEVSDLHAEGIKLSREMDTLNSAIAITTADTAKTALQSQLETMKVRGEEIVRSIDELMTEEANINEAIRIHQETKRLESEVEKMQETGKPIPQPVVEKPSTASCDFQA